MFMLFHSNANTRPIGRVKCTSSHSSVSFDLNEACSNSENDFLSLLVSITIYYKSLYIIVNAKSSFFALPYYIIRFAASAIALAASSRHLEKLGQSLKSMMQNVPSALTIASPP